MSLTNIKYLVYVSDSNQIMSFNNLEEFDEVLEDVKDGIFDEFQRVKDFLQKDEDISMLLSNEFMTLWVILGNMLTFTNISECFLIFIILFLISFKGLKFTQEKSYLISGSLVIGAFVFFLFFKLF